MNGLSHPYSSLVLSAWRLKKIIVKKTSPSGLAGYQRRLVSKPASPLLPTIEAICESEASKCAPMGPPSMYCFEFVMHALTSWIWWLFTFTALTALHCCNCNLLGHRMSQISEMNKVANKRMSLAKNPEAQKRGKVLYLIQISGL